MRCPLINTPLQRGDSWSADFRTVSTVLLYPLSAKPLKRFRPTRSPNTQLKLGVNEKPLSNLVLQFTRTHWAPGCQIVCAALFLR